MQPEALTALTASLPALWRGTAAEATQWLQPLAVAVEELASTLPLPQLAGVLAVADTLQLQVSSSALDAAAARLAGAGARVLPAAAQARALTALAALGAAPDAKLAARLWRRFESVWPELDESELAAAVAALQRLHAQPEAGNVARVEADMGRRCAGAMAQGGRGGHVVMRPGGRAWA